MAMIANYNFMSINVSKSKLDEEGRWVEHRVFQKNTFSKK